jgi:hypothetical protein
MGDVDFANDFASELWRTLDQLKKQSQMVAKDCIDRKHALEAALNGIEKYMGDGKKEELIELTGVNNA